MISTTAYCYACGKLSEIDGVGLSQRVNGHDEIRTQRVWFDCSPDPDVVHGMTIVVRAA